MSDDIIDIQLTPAWDSPSIRSRLGHALSDADLLQGAIAYWTVDSGFLGHSLPRKLSSPNGFVCVDVNLPTNIDALAELACQGADVRIHAEDIPTFGADGRREPRYLMHAKMLLFWTKDKGAELWVGSHNWTNRAIWGLNIESSLVIRLKNSSRLFFEAAEYLQKIKAICQPFDPSRKDFYKELQNRDERTVAAFEVEAIDASDLSGLEISIFGTDEMDFRDARAVNQKVYLEATEPTDETKYIYSAEINGVHRLNSANPAAGTLAFSPRRYAFRTGRKGLPVLLPQSDVTADVLRNARYYVNLELKQRRDSMRLDYPSGRTATWAEVVDFQQSPILSRLGAEERAMLFRGRAVQLRVPVALNPEAPRQTTLNERRNENERSIVSRRVVRSR